jgi:hypothetical protein
LAVPRALGPVFMFCAPGLVFGGTECVASRFYVLRARTRFWRYRGRRVPFSCFACPESFSAVLRASGAVFIFYTPRLVFSGVECFVSLFHVLRQDSFSTVPRASSPVFMFCAPVLVLGDVECVRSRFHVLRSQTRFQRCRMRRVPVSCFARQDSFSGQSWA